MILGTYLEHSYNSAHTFPHSLSPLIVKKWRAPSAPSNYRLSYTSSASDRSSRTLNGQLLYHLTLCVILHAIEKDMEITIFDILAI